MRATWRWIWGQLTSMRTALLLLFLLALAAIPGSMVPQRSISPIDVINFKAEHPRLDKVYEPLGMYEVYTSVWFSAIYLLLFISLAGCIIPRIGIYLRALRKPPPRLVANPQKLPVGASATAADDALDRAEDWLRAHRYRVRREAEGISAERGHAREAGNIVFHSALVVLLAGLAWSNLKGFEGSAVIVEGQAFSNVVTQYDDFTSGAAVNLDQLEPFTLRLDEFHVEFETGEVQRGAARRFDADVTLTAGGAASEELLQVNRPIMLQGGTQISLLGHGYAQVVRVTDGDGNVAFAGPVPFLPQDGNFGSVGVIKAPDARPHQLAFEGFFFPTAVLNENGPHSVFPDALQPELFLNAWFGAPREQESGIPESIYVLNPDGLEPVPSGSDDRLRMRLQPGDVYELPNGLGTMEYLGWSRWIKVQVSQSPGSVLSLIAIAVGTIGLCFSLFVKPRRMFVRLRDGQVLVGGVDRTDTATGLDDEVNDLLANTQSGAEVGTIASGQEGAP